MRPGEHTEHDPRAGAPMAASGEPRGGCPPVARGALSLAHQHARLCEAVESCAPPVTATRLQRAYDRMRSGVTVRIADPLDPRCEPYFVVERGRSFWCADTAEYATRLYLAVCDRVLAETDTAAPDLVTADASTSPAALVAGVG